MKLSQKDRELVKKCIINKWDAIVGGHVPIEDALQRCYLCDEYLEQLYFSTNVSTTDSSYLARNSCTDCPLKAAGHGCLEKNSTFRQLQNHIEDGEPRSSDFYDKALEYCEIIRGCLVELLEEVGK